MVQEQVRSPVGCQVEIQLKFLSSYKKFPLEEMHILKHIPSGCSTYSNDLKMCVCVWSLRERPLWRGVERSVAGGERSCENLLLPR